MYEQDAVRKIITEAEKAAKEWFPESTHRENYIIGILAQQLYKERATMHTIEDKIDLAYEALTDNMIDDMYRFEEEEENDVELDEADIYEQEQTNKGFCCDICLPTNFKFIEVNL